MDKHSALTKRAMRQRYKLKLFGGGKLRLSVFRSNQHIHAQIIDDGVAKTLVACSSMEPDVRSKVKSTSNVAAAEMVGKTIAERAIASGIKEVMFDRGGYQYHGRVKAVAEAARKAGIKC